MSTPDTPVPIDVTEPSTLPRRTARVLDAVARTAEPPAPFSSFALPTTQPSPPAPAQGPAQASTRVPTQVPAQRVRVRAARPARHRALPPPPDLWTPPPGSPVCTCGMALRPQDDACSVCGLIRVAGLRGVLSLTGRHWLSGLRRR